MNTQKKFFLALLIISFFPSSYLFANDGVSNSALWLHSNNLITCVSVENIDEVNTNGDMLVFDYSQTVGVKKEKPWTIVEKGKCYEIDVLPPAGENQNSINSGELFLFTKPSLEIRNKLKNYGLYKPSDSIGNIFRDRTNVTCGQSTDPNYFEYNPDADACNALPNAIDIFPYGLGLGIDNLIRYTNVSIGDILDTNYTFGDGVSGFTSSYSDEGRAYVESAEVSEIRKIHESLATELESVIEKCDIRTREEIRLNFKKNEYGWYEIERKYISRYENGVDKELSFVSDYKNFRISAIKKAEYYLENIGCKANVVTYLESKHDEVSKINKLADTLKSKFLSNQEIGWYMSMKSEDEKNELANFYKKTPPENKISMDSENAIPDSEKTELETPTIKEKINIFSNDNKMKIYWLLPFIGLVLVGGILFFGKRK